MLYVLTIITGLAGTAEADSVTTLRGRYETIAACMVDATVIVIDPALQPDRWIKATCNQERGV